MWAPSRSKRGAARRIDWTFTLNVNSDVGVDLRDEVSVRFTLEEERRLASLESREVVLEHIEVCAPRAFFWTAVCLLCDE